MPVVMRDMQCLWGEASSRQVQQEHCPHAIGVCAYSAEGTCPRTLSSKVS